MQSAAGTVGEKGGPLLCSGAGREKEPETAIKKTPEGVLKILEAKPGFEPGVKALQASALPLGHFAIMQRADRRVGPQASNGADNGARTRDPNLGKVVLYQLSHVRLRESNIRDSA